MRFSIKFENVSARLLDDDFREIAAYEVKGGEIRADLKKLGGLGEVFIMAMQSKHEPKAESESGIKWTDID